MQDAPATPKLKKKAIIKKKALSSSDEVPGEMDLMMVVSESSEDAPGSPKLKQKPIIKKKAMSLSDEVLGEMDLDLMKVVSESSEDAVIVGVVSTRVESESKPAGRSSLASDAAVSSNFFEMSRRPGHAD